MCKGTQPTLHLVPSIMAPNQFLRIWHKAILLWGAKHESILIRGYNKKFLVLRQLPFGVPQAPNNKLSSYKPVLTGMNPPWDLMISVITPARHKPRSSYKNGGSNPVENRERISLLSPFLLLRVRCYIVINKGLTDTHHEFSESVCIFL